MHQGNKKIDFINLINEAYETVPMSESGNKSITEVTFAVYKLFIKNQFPDSVNYWPSVSGADFRAGFFKEFQIIIFIHTANTSFRTITSFGEISLNIPNEKTKNIEAIRNEVIKIFSLTRKDSVFIFDTTNNFSNLDKDMEREILINFKRHKITMNMIPMKVFLSHKSTNKQKVREFKDCLQLLGFQPWLDEDAMQAGSHLERSLQQGMKDSCAAIFFITPDYKDESYLASEVDYAIARKREDSSFAIITLVLSNEQGDKGQVPDLLRPYVWKEPSSDLIALNDILKALPLQVGNVEFKS